MLEISSREFKITMISMLNVQKEILNIMQEQMDNFSREMEKLKQNQVEILEIEKIEAKCLQWAHQSTDIAKKRIHELEIDQ